MGTGGRHKAAIAASKDRRPRGGSANAAAAPHPLWRAALGLLCLDAAFALVVALAAHPPQRVAAVRLALPAAPGAPAPARAVVAYSVTTPIRDSRPRLADLALVREAATPWRVDSRVDAIAPATTTAVAEAVAPRRWSASVVDAIERAPRRSTALSETASCMRRATDRLAPGPTAPSLDAALAAFAAAAAGSVDRLIAVAAPTLDRPGRAVVARGRVDALTPSVVAVSMRDETAWAAGAPAWSSEPPRPDLLPALRPSPAVLLARWLPELDTAAPTAERKTEFVRVLLPLVMRVNEAILHERERVVALAPEIDAAHELSDSDARAAAELLQAARLDAWSTAELLLRLDAVPLSMALAQAAQESGWGRSRPAREDNALFGQMMFAPASAPQVQPFGGLLETVEAYARNLNTHRAYAEFRRRRAALRARGDMLDGHALVAFIPRYSVRGPRYIEAVRQVMRINNLSLLDAAVLDAVLDSALPPLDGAMLGHILAADPLDPDAPAQGMDN